MIYSYSKLTSFYDCPYSFYRNYILHEKGDTNSFAEYGILVHSILESYAKNKISIWDLTNEFISGFDLRITEPILMFGKDLTDSYREKGITFFDGFSGFWGLEPLESEYRFTTSLTEKDELIGIIDLITKDENGNLIIIDHKSSSKFTKKELKQKARQLYLYSKAIYDKYGKFPTEMWFNHFKNNHIEKIKFNSEDFEEAMKWANDTIEKIESCMEYEPNTSSKFFCVHLCDYRNKCEYLED